MKRLKNLFKKFNIDGYIIPKNDEYFNEYVDSSNDRLKFISNFSGSAGFAVILKNKNFLFVDGRYTTQARYQSSKKFKIMTMPNKFPKDVLRTKRKIILGFDPKLHTEKQLNFMFGLKNIDLKLIKKNLIDMIWVNKPKDVVKPFYSISQKNAGINYSKKIENVKKVLLKNKLDFLLVTAPENIAWLLNIRGHDSPYTPIPKARLLINKSGEIDLFANFKKLKNIKNIRVNQHDDKKIGSFLSLLTKKNIWIDPLSCSFFFKNLLKRNNKVIEKLDPIYFLKSIKNKTEIKNMKKIHVIDGAALTKFLIWLKTNFKKIKITEISAQKN